MNRDELLTNIPEDLRLTHDGYFREAFEIKRLGQVFLKKLLPREALVRLDLNGLTVEPRHQTDDRFKETIADVVYRVPVKRTKKHINFFVVMEHKSYQDFLTVFQLWCYVYLICRREFLAARERGEVRAGYRLPPVAAIIVHHGPSKFKGKTQLAELFLPLPGLEQYLPGLQAILFDLNSIADDDPIMNDPEVPELKVVLMVLKTVFRRDVALKVKDVLEALKPHSDDPTTRRLIRATLVYLANNAKHLRRSFETFLGTIKETTGEKNMPTMVEIWLAEGEAKGEARGEARGAVLAFLRAKFNRVPAEVESEIRSMTDLTALQSLATHAETCQSLEEFEKSLR